MRTRAGFLAIVATTLAAVAGLPLAHAQAPGQALGPVVVLAHRGASFYAPEHTYFAYDLAIEQDADFIECDLQISADDVLVCVHDDTVDRTSDGSGPVRDHTLAELQQLDWGTWFNDANPGRARPEYAGADVVTFESQIDCYRSINPNIRFHVETKAPSLYDGRMEPLLVDLLGRKGLLATGNNDIQTSQVVIQSFDLASLRAVKQLAPTLPTAYLWREPPPEVLDGSMPEGVDAAAPIYLHLLADPTFVERAHMNGHEVHTYTVDDPDQMGVLLDMGVDGIFTNRPDLLRAAVDERGVGVPAAERGNPSTVDPPCPRAPLGPSAGPVTSTTAAGAAPETDGLASLPATGRGTGPATLVLVVLLGAGVVALPLLGRRDDLSRH